MIDPERRAQRAQALLNDDVLKEAFDLIEADCISQWKACSTLAHRKREKLWFELKALESLKSKLQNAVSDGRISAANRK